MFSIKAITENVTLPTVELGVIHINHLQAVSCKKTTRNKSERNKDYFAELYQLDESLSAKFCGKIQITRSLRFSAFLPNGGFPSQLLYAYTQLEKTEPLVSKILGIRGWIIIKANEVC